MPRPRFHRADPALRSAVLEAAVREFAEHGYDGASLNRILLAAGLSKGSFYYYFEDKADLAATVLERELETYMAEFAHLPRVDHADEFWQVIARYSAIGLAKLREAPQQSNLITRLGVALGKHPELMNRCAPLFARSQQQLAEFWRRGQQVGAVRADLALPVLLALVQAMKVALTTSLLPADRAPTAEELDVFTRIHLDMVRRVTQP